MSRPSAQIPNHEPAYSAVASIHRNEGRQARRGCALETDRTRLRHKGRPELDVYANTEKFPKPKPHARRTYSADAFKDVGLKSEINSIAQIAAKKTTIKKLHNKLINRLNDYLRWRQKTVKESKFDA